MAKDSSAPRLGSDIAVGAGTDDWAGPPCPDLPLEARIEAVLLAADRPLSETRLVEILGLLPPAKPKRRPGGKQAATDDADSEGESESGGAGDRERRQAVQAVRAAVDSLNASYASTRRSFRVESLAGGWQILSLPAFGPLLIRLKGERQQTRLSQAALETLAIIAYRQPILRADLEAIRGVACGEVLKSLMDRRLVRIVGRAEEIGRPMLYGTTKEFLRIFGIASLQDLPKDPAKEAVGSATRR
jgi:segregation and condensation protein B